MIKSEFGAVCPYCRNVVPLAEVKTGTKDLVDCPRCKRIFKVEIRPVYCSYKLGGNQDESKM